jgi:hypothetical protein
LKSHAARAPQVATAFASDRGRASGLGEALGRCQCCQKQPGESHSFAQVVEPGRGGLFEAHCDECMLSQIGSSKLIDSWADGRGQAQRRLNGVGKQAPANVEQIHASFHAVFAALGAIPTMAISKVASGATGVLGTCIAMMTLTACWGFRFARASCAPDSRSWTNTRGWSPKRLFGNTARRRSVWVPVAERQLESKPHT